MGTAAGIQSSNAFATVLIAGPDGKAAALDVARNSWEGSKGGPVAYTSTDCSGQAFIPLDLPVGSQFEPIFGITAGFYEPHLNVPLWVQSGPLQTIQVASLSDGSGCGSAAPGPLQAVPATPTTMMYEFVLPFSIRLVR